MFTNALYYPYILIPDNLWLRRAILYWDKISPIVPHEVEEQIPYTHISKELEKHKVLEFIHPESVLEWYEGAELSESFLNIVRSKEFLSKIGPPEKRSYKFRIHRDKFAEGLLKKLSDLHLFKMKENDPSWLLFEPYSGTIYMGFLASSLSKSLDLEPITDDKIYQNGFLWSQLIPSSSSSTFFMSLVLDELLPAPREEIPVEKIIEFRKKYEMELLAFRRRLRSTVESLEKVTEESQLREIINSVKDDIREQSLILDSKLKDNEIETVFNTLETPFKVSVPEMGAIALAGAISIPIGAIAYGVNASIKIAKEIFKGRTRRNSILEASPYAYVINVKRKLA